METKGKKNKDKVDELAVKKVFVSCIGGRLLNIQNFEMIPDQQRMSWVSDDLNISEGQHHSKNQGNHREAKVLQGMAADEVPVHTVYLSVSKAFKSCKKVKTCGKKPKSWVCIFWRKQE